MTHIEEILFDADVIEAKVREMAKSISSDYEGRDLILVGILKGAAVFLADLMRGLSIPAAVDFVRARSYGDSSSPAAAITVDLDLEADIRGRDVLLVDMIVDTGQTLAFLLERYAGRGPESLKAAVLLDKRSRRTVDVPLEYCGFTVPDRFLVGYGIDCAEQYRTLPYIAAVRISP